MNLILYVSICSQLFTETLRKYSPAGFLSRKSVEDYIIESTKTFIPKGTNVIIPHYSIHRESRNYSNPEIFDPERFINNQTFDKPSAIYLPFGDGPRYCLGKFHHCTKMRGDMKPPNLLKIRFHKFLI